MMIKTNVSNQNTTGKNILSCKVVLGEFWVDSDGEIFVDITNPREAIADTANLHAIKALQRKLTFLNMKIHKTDRNPQR